MWNRHNDNDILDFALLWEPLGGPGLDNVAAAFAIDVREYHVRLGGAAKSELARLQQGITSPERIYGLSTIAAFDRDLRTDG
ncbi:hypothetical protein CJ179_13285 [Rhodococcus sp. ACS1]|uniref:hypothetical protein n=1 Tax=Rhodococcus sp. ACS1 TaxID=2028570 RepID=UPI000BB14A11|nr:hypothetical protein [Rhodococcus sp. ACS1]PBC47874.1 hypothetical protein CJ179_13285 [Rhodococcus sp. ACS1]